MEEVENTRRKLESITIDKCKRPSLSGTTLTPQTSWNSREMDENTKEPNLQRGDDFQNVRSMSVQSPPDTVSRRVKQTSTILLIFSDDSFIQWEVADIYRPSQGP
jgi:hypothetical protein